MCLWLQPESFLGDFRVGSGVRVWVVLGCLLGCFGVVLGSVLGSLFGVAESAKMCFSLQPEQHSTNCRVVVFLGFGVALVSIVRSFCCSFFVGFKLSWGRFWGEFFGIA